MRFSAFFCYAGSMEMQRVPMDEFLRALDWAHYERWKMYIREIRYRTTPDGRREPVIGDWYEMRCGDKQLFWTNPSTLFFLERDRSVKLDRTMRFRIDLKEGKADVRDGKGLYLQIRIEIPDLL